MEPSTKIYARIPQFILKNDFVYINERLVALEMEEIRLQLDRSSMPNKEAIQYTIENETDSSDSDSIPKCRNERFEDYFGSQMRIKK